MRNFFIFILLALCLLISRPAVVAVAVMVSPLAVVVMSVVLVVAAGVICAGMIAWAYDTWLDVLPPKCLPDTNQGRRPGESQRLDERQVSSLGDAWHQQLLIFAFIAGQYGSFSRRRMEGHCTRDAYQKFVNALVAAGVIETRKAGAYWSDGWCYSRLRVEVKHCVLAIPEPPGELPRVTWERCIPAGGQGGRSGWSGRASSVILDGSGHLDREG